MSLLIVSFYFPPYKGVGGRRWAKHVKSLSKLGLKIYVLAGDFQGQSSPWDKDIKPYQDSIYRIPITPVKSPYYKRTLPKNFIEKLVWKSSQLYGKYKENRVNGNFGDISSDYERLFFQFAAKLIQEKNIDQLIISGGPFRYTAMIIDLKRIFPNLSIILDYRDYWEDGFHILSEKQQKYEKEIQQTVLQNADHVITVNDEMANYFKTTFKKDSVYVLPHCFDPDDILEKTEQGWTKESAIPSELKFIYGGALYNEIGDYISVFLDFLSALKKRNHPVIADIYVPYRNYQTLFDQSEIKCNVSDFIPVEEFFVEMNNHNYVILFLPNWRANAMSSKFFELIAFRKPILYFGPQGEVADFIHKHALGWHVTKKNFDETIRQFLLNLETRKIPNKGYDLSTHTFDYQTKLFVDELKIL